MGFHLVYLGDDDTLDLGIPLLNYGEECSLPTLLVNGSNSASASPVTPVVVESEIAWASAFWQRPGRRGSGKPSLTNPQTVCWQDSTG